MTTIDYAMRVANRLQSEGKLEQAQSIVNSILEADPNQPEALHLSGIIAYHSGKISAGIQWIQQAIENRPDCALFHTNLGEMYRQSKDLQASIHSGQRALALDPNSATVLSNLGIAYYDAKEYDQAKEYHQRALALDPKFTCSLNNMGSIYKIQGKTHSAIQFYQAAIAASPHAVDPLNNLGALFLEQEEFSLALEYLTRALKLAPLLPNIHCNIGLALLGLNHSQKALLHFQQALQTHPRYAEAYYGLAKLYLRKHDFIASEQAIRQAIALNAETLEFYQLLAEIEHQQGHSLKALAHLDHALTLDPTHSNLYLGKGSIFMTLGETSHAEAQFLKMAEAPSADTRVLAHYSLVQLRKTQADSVSLKALFSLAHQSHEISRDKLAYLYFALGKCHDDLGEWSQAFKYFTQGCALKRKRIPYDSKDQIRFTQQLIHCFTEETLEYLRKFAHPSSVPIFIVGMPRSGSTLVEQILASHPQGIHAAGELPYLNELIQSSREAHSTKLRYPENIPHLSPENCHAITTQYLFYLRRISKEAAHITDKMPQNFIALGLIHALFPNAKIIHVKRHPLDICLSCYTKLFTEGHFYSYDLTELGQYYQCYERIMDHWRRTLPPHAWLEIDYEMVIQNVETEAKRLINYCELPWDPACLAFYEAKRPVHTASFMQVREPIYASSVNRWRRFEKELAPLINILRASQIL